MIASAREAGYQGEATNGAVSRGPAQGWQTRGRPRVVRGVVRASYDVTIASRCHPFLPRSMTRPCIPCPAPPRRSRRPQPLPPPSSTPGLNQLVPVLKGAAAVSATWQPCLYLASTPPRTLATSCLAFLSLQSTSHRPACMLDRGLSLHPLSLCPSRVSCPSSCSMI